MGSSWLQVIVLSLLGIGLGLFVGLNVPRSSPPAPPQDCEAEALRERQSLQQLAEILDETRRKRDRLQSELASVGVVPVPVDEATP